MEAVERWDGLHDTVQSWLTSPLTQSIMQPSLQQQNRLSSVIFTRVFESQFISANNFILCHMLRV